MDKEGDAATTSLPTFLIHTLDQLLRLKSSVAKAQTLSNEQTKTTNCREFADRVHKLIVNLKDSINTIERSFSTCYETFLDTELSSHIVVNALNHEHSYAQLDPAALTETTQKTPPAIISETAEETPTATLTNSSGERVNGEIESLPPIVESSKTNRETVSDEKQCVPVMHDETEKSGSSSEQQELKSEMNDSEVDPPKRGFIKCIDITKLLDPTKVPIPKTPEIVNGSRHTNDSIITLSSDSDTDKKKNKLNERSSSNKKKKVTVAQKKEEKKIEKKKKKEEDSDSDVPIAARVRPQRHKATFEQLKQLRQRRLVTKQVRYASSSSSSSSSDSEEEKDYSKQRRQQSPSDAPTTAVTDLYDFRNDQKFSQQCTVSLVRIPVEQLKQFSLEQAEEVEVQR